MKVKKGGTECDLTKCTYKVTSEGKYEIKDANSCRNDCPNPLKAYCLPKTPNSLHPRDCIISRGRDIVGQPYTQCEIAKYKTGCTWIHRGEWEKNCRCIQGLHENKIYKNVTQINVYRHHNSSNEKEDIKIKPLYMYKVIFCSNNMKMVIIILNKGLKSTESDKEAYKVCSMRKSVSI